jgi:hypothetical protein
MSYYQRFVVIVSGESLNKSDEEIAKYLKEWHEHTRGQHGGSLQSDYDGEVLSSKEDQDKGLFFIEQPSHVCDMLFPKACAFDLGFTKESCRFFDTFIRWYLHANTHPVIKDYLHEEEDESSSNVRESS